MFSRKPKNTTPNCYFSFLFFDLSLASMLVGKSLNEALSYIIEQFNCEMSLPVQTDYLTIPKVLTHHFVKDQELGLDLRISFQNVLLFMHFHEVGQCILINFW